MREEVWNKEPNLFCAKKNMSASKYFAFTLKNTYN